MSLLLHGDCLDELKNLDDNSVDLIFCDLPYGQTSCKWDTIIPWEPFWNEILRIKKLNTPIFFTTTTKFGVELINNAPKKCPFRYDLVWVKSAPAGFLSAKKMPMRKHEMVYVFYEKLPLYDLSSHKHKFIKDGTKSKEDVYELSKKDEKNLYGRESKGALMGKEWKKVNGGVKIYDPLLPSSVVKEEPEEIKYDQEHNSELYGNIKRDDRKNKIPYDPPLPNTLLEIKSTRGKHSTEKPVALMEWILKYYSKEGDVVLDPTMGSGSTGVACKNMNRNFIGIEKDPEIYEGAVNRIN